MRHKLLLLLLLVCSYVSSFAQSNEYIDERPEGISKLYKRSGDAFTNKQQKPVRTTQQGGFVEIVFAPDGETVYIKNPLSALMLETWVRGSIKDNTITLPMEQMLFFSQTYQYGYRLVVMKGSPDVPEYVWDETIHEITYLIEGDRITMQGTKEDGSVVLGAVWSDNLAWTCYADWNTVYETLDAGATKAPEDAIFEPYHMTGESTLDIVSKEVELAYVDNDVYIKGACTLIPEGIIKGVFIDDTHIKFEAGQFLGESSGLFFYLLGLDDNNSVSDLLFEYNPTEDKLVQISPYMVFCDDASTATFSYEKIHNSVFAPQSQQEDQSVITLVTTADIGDYIPLSIESSESIQINGASMVYGGLCEVESPTITIRGAVTGIDATACQLTALDLSATTTLRQLWCGDNQLKELDLSSLRDLEILYCVQNQIERLDLSATPHLKELDCSQNKLTTLDLTDLPELEIFLCYHNDVAQIDLSPATQLKGIDLSENRLTELDLSHNTLLETLYCNGNEINAVSMKALVETLPDRSEMEKKGDFFCIDTKNEQERNVIYQEDVTRAVQKGWTTLDYAGGENDGNGISYAGSTDIAPIAPTVLTIYPNPAQEQINIEGATPHSQIVLSTVEGQQLCATTADATSSALIEVSTLPTGHYLLQVNGQAICIEILH